MRHFLFNSLVSRLRQITDTDGNPVIKSFDIWNNNLQYLNVGQAFELPAVFIEFAPLSWSHQGKGVRDAIATVRLHVLQQATSPSLSERGYTEEFLTRFDLLTSINLVLHGYSSLSDTFGFGALTSTLSTTDSDYGEVTTDIEEYQCHCTDTSILAESELLQPAGTLSLKINP